jgi:hypothetical protein
MTEISMDALTLSHTAITFIAIATGLMVLGQMLDGKLCRILTGTFLLTTLLTSVTGLVFFHPPSFTPAQGTGVVALLALIPTLYGLYMARLAGPWRLVYVIGAVFSLYLNVFVLVVQLFQKLPTPPVTGGPLFGATQGVVLLAFIAAGWMAAKSFHPSGAQG